MNRMNRSRLSALLEEEGFFRAAFQEDEAIPESKSPIANSARNKLQSAFGRTALIVDFFNLYGELHRLFVDITENDGKNKGGSRFWQRLKKSLDAIDSRITDEASRNRAQAKFDEVTPFLRKLDSGQDLPQAMWRQLTSDYADMIQALGADKGIYLVPRRLAGKSPVRWLRLQRAAPREEAVEKFRREDPDLYERMQQSKAQKRKINEEIQGRITEEGYTPAIRPISVYGKKGPRRFMNVGLNDAGEIEFVYDADGSRLTITEFVDKVRDRNETLKGLRKINPAKNMWFKQLNHMREMGAEEIENLPGEIEYVSLTDDPEKDTALTRIYPTKKDKDGNRVVVAGRFKGIYMSDLVNASGRMIEGSVVYYHPDTGEMVRRDVRDDGGEVNVRKQTEPYVTVDDDGNFLMRVSFFNLEEDVAIRKALRKLRIPSVEAVKGTRSQLWRFEAKDFAAIRKAVGGMAMSSQAAKKLKAHFDELTRAEQAANATNLERFSAERLGLRWPLRTMQAKALAWLDANGNKGVCALDTGMGKTAIAIATIQNLRAKGEDGRFLFVCEKDLLGNLPKEIYKFMPDKESADELNDLVDRLSYRQFNTKRRKDKNFGSEYVAIFFDEAHKKMGKKHLTSYRRAVTCPCKHKVLLTASPMTKSPREALVLSSVGNSMDLNTKEGRKFERDFEARFAQKVGGRVVGVTDEPVAARDFRVYIKRNLFFADKREVELEEEGALAKSGEGASGRDLRKDTLAVTMPPEIEVEYRKAMKDVMKILKPLARSDYREFVDPSAGTSTRLSPQDPRSLAIAAERIANRLSRPLDLLTMLSNTPNRVIPGAGNPKLDKATDIIRNNGGGRILMWGSNNALIEDTFARMQKEFPGKAHVAGFKNHILYASMSGVVYRYRPRGSGGIFIDGPDGKEKMTHDPKTGRRIKSEEWKVFVLTGLLGMGTSTNAKSPFTATLEDSYSTGQNLQSFNTVIHIDRDTWNNETMKQRTARAWRAGNKEIVDEYTLDMVYEEPVANDDAEKTLDQLREIIQNIDANLFDRVVVDSQVEKLGEEWLEIKKQRSALYAIDRKMLERAMSPYASQVGSTEGGG